MDNRLLVLYFVIGGSVVAAVTYFGSHGKGLLAAFVSMLPSVSAITLVTVYLNGGSDASVSYFKNMLWLVPAWLLYIVATMLLLPRLGLVPSLAIGMALYVGGVFLIQALTQR